jgi:hypothetical protein
MGLLKRIAPSFYFWSYILFFENHEDEYIDSLKIP